ncbi:MAG TPA: hemerythrin domain-containing protein [Telluria sp.]|jgi:uncharacterized protein YfaS (alpha-2-macroglobulin family)
MITICTHLMQDSERCDALLAQACADVGAMAWSSGTRALAIANAALARHLLLEEQYLFGAYDTVMQGGAIVTDALRAEHARVSAAMAAMEQAVLGRQREQFLQHADDLRKLLAHHHLQEQNAFYPLVARMLKARATLVSAPRSFPSSPPHSDQAAGTHSALFRRG